MIRGRERDRRQEIRGQVERGGARSAQRYDPLRLGDQNSKKSIDLELAPLQRLAKASDAGMGLCRPEPLLALYGALSTIIGAVRTAADEIRFMAAMAVAFWHSARR